MGVFCCVVSSHFCGKEMIPFHKHTRSSGWIKYQDMIYIYIYLYIYRCVFVVNGIADFVSLPF